MRRDIGDEPVERDILAAGTLEPTLEREIEAVAVKIPLARTMKVNLRSQEG